MNRVTLGNDLAQLWIQLDVMQTLYFEPGRNAYREAMESVGAGVAITSDPTQVSFSADLSVEIAGLTDDTSDAELSELVAAHILEVLTALASDVQSSVRGIGLFGRLCEVELPVINGLSAARVSQKKQREKLTRMLNIAAFYQLASVIVEHSYQDKNAAHTHRQRFTEIGMGLQRSLSVADDLTLYQVLNNLITIVGQAFRGFSDELVPVGYYSPSDDMSVLAVSWNLYQDLTWAEDLVARNNNIASILLMQPVEYLAKHTSERMYY